MKKPDSRCVIGKHLVHTFTVMQLASCGRLVFTVAHQQTPVR